MISIEINDDAIAAALTRVGAKMDDMSEVMQGLSELLLASTQDRMLRGEQPDGTAFAPRSQATLDIYAAKNQSFGGVLSKTGDMRLQLASDSGADFVTIGSNAIQAAVMQFGASKSAYPHLWGDIPARPFLGISDEDQVSILAELSDWLEDAASGRT